MQNGHYKIVNITERRPAGGRALSLAIAGLLLLGAGGVGGAPYVRHKDRQDGTIHDQRTNLLWQKCGYGQKFSRNGCAGKPRRLTWSAADKYCKKLGLGKYEWRLPGVKELEYIGDPAKGNPGLDVNMFPGAPPYEYWGHNRFNDFNGLQYSVYSFHRNYRFSTGGGKYFVRCVSDKWKPKRKKYRLPARPTVPNRSRK